MNVTKRRRSIYFTEDDSDLLEYVNQKDITFNRYLMRLIREDMERDGDISNKELLTQLKELLSAFNVPQPYPFPYPSPYYPVSSTSIPPTNPTLEEEEKFDDIDGL